MNEPLKTVSDWKAFLAKMPDESQILFDTLPLTGGGFEYARPFISFPPTPSGNNGCCSFSLTKYGE